MGVDFNAVEKKWQKKWFSENIFKVKKSTKKKFYNLEMFPYPSGSGLHMGHALNFTIGDIFARFKRMQGFNVLYPMGYDSFGLPAENAAIKNSEHPKKYTEKSIKNFRKQLESLGFSYDWGRTLKTSDEEYYKWNQLFFLKFLEKGLAYRKKAPVNWCGKCKTVLANEQVHDGKCWRHEDTEVEIKYLEQWFLKTTKYSDELLDMVDDLNWPDRIKTMQKNWIGRSEGTEILFEINNEKIPVFTTRPDTIYGVTFMVISAQHEKLMDFVTKEQKKEVEDFLKKIKSASQKDIDLMEKEGVFTGSYAVNPLTDERIPVYAGNFVLAEYGSGIVMAVPAHDQRDYDFAKKYEIPIKLVIQPNDSELDEKNLREAYTGEGFLINSDKFDNMKTEKARWEITKFLKKKNLGKKTLQYKFKDWLVSRQRYWGTPIPVVYCDKCGVVPVPEKDLPVKLPEKVKFGKGNPLKTNKKFLETKCPKCNEKAKRETDTMDTFFDSSWYYLRYCDNKNFKEPFDKKKIEYWMPVNQYIGGAEHATMHLIYARFFTKALRDLGFLEIDEPFLSLFNQGMLHASDGRKMSKSLGNVIDPINITKKYSADSLRLALMSFASPDKDTIWDEKVLKSSFKFLNRVYEYFDDVKIVKKTDKKTQHRLNKTIKQVTEKIQNFKYNLAIIEIRNLFDKFSDENSKAVLESFLKMLHVFCPHVTEELWEKLGGKKFLSLEKWPEFDESKIDKTLEKQEQAVEKLIDDINHVSELLKNKQDKIPKKAFIYVLPDEKNNFMNDLDMIQKRTNLDSEVYAVNDKEKYDPENKSKKVKPGRPGIYLE